MRPSAKKASAGRRRSEAKQAEQQALQHARSTWERITLAQDVELHLRRPLSRLQDQRVKRLLVQAREIFDKEES